MAERGEISVITLGGKGISLSPSSLYAVATGLAQVRADSSALDRLASSSSNQRPPSVNHEITLPKTFTIVESRAFLTVLLNKLLLSASPGIRTVLPVRFSEALNSRSQALEFEPLDVTQEELYVLEKSSSALYGVFAILDHESAALSVVSDAVAAISCEAARADLAAFNSVDSGDGFSAKEEVVVASDMKVLLNGSKLVGKVESLSVSKIPKLHGCLRKIAKLVHTETRIGLNSGVAVANAEGPLVHTVLSPLASALYYLGECSLNRAKSNLDLVGSDDLRSSLGSLFERKCVSSESFSNAFELVSELGCKKEYEKFVHEVNVLLGMVWKIVAWEAITGFIALEGVEWNEKSEKGVEVNGGNVKVERKSEKKKKVVLGKGTGVIVQLIKDRLQGKGVGGIGGSGLLEIWVGELLLFLHPKDREFDGLLQRVREIVESNESRRLPKLPKGTRDFSKEQMTIRKGAFSLIEGVFEKHGAMALDTPVFELRETLMGKYGEDSKLIYDLADQIKLNHRKLLDGMLDICGVPPEKFRTICSSIDKLDKQSFEQIKKEMVEEKGLTVETADKIGTFVKERGPPLELLSKLKREDSKFLEHEGSVNALNDLDILFKALDKSKCIDKVVFDLSLARGLDYYTGVIFEAIFKGGTQVGSIAAGGRYDNLIGMFGTKQVPAVGVSLGIERVFAIMEQLHKDHSQTTRATKTEVLVSILGDDLPLAAEVVSELWDAEVNAEYLVNKRVMKHIEHARESRIPWMVIMGERERSEGIVKLKNVEAAEEEEIPMSRLVEELKIRLKR
ncbi:histidine--tRNA ligase, cytoplasmic-like isoform X2 [Corylus avellana]|uniref:histidine--tRNA ligase, cytoplasmic-like isoform X2 n=1 Tax=Corylus avellana TaxID=13451 RepID=UPI00286C5380|nr:histidine--tRNA ligase, cytoplasmic-like isoform X2 [Corylus avellana]